MEEQVMWNILGRQMTPYAVCVWLACLAALAVFLWQGRKLKPAALICTAVLGTALGLLGARLYYVLCRWELFQEFGMENFFAATEEGLKSWGTAMGAAFWGAVGGVALAAWIAGRVTKERTASLLDALAPAAALGIAISRFGEYSIGEGIGPEVYEEGLQFFPLAVMNEWEEWNYALFLLEGLTGLVIFLTLMIRGRKWKDGYRARAFLILYASSQIVLEALRRDNFLRWLFVRISQVVAALVLLVLVIFGLRRWLRERKTGERSSALRLTGRVLIWTAGILAGLFAFLAVYQFLILGNPMEMSGSLWYEMICDSAVPVLILLIAGIGGLILSAGKSPATEWGISFRTAMLLIGAIVVIALEFGIDKSANLSIGMGYLMEAVCSVIMGLAAWNIVMKH